jgi:methylase of polypeptide subunit release factors
MVSSHQVLPNSGPAREALREKGQFWTPDWVADAMVAYVLHVDTDHVFDPAVGTGAFLAAAKRMATYLGRKVKLLGTEIDPTVLHKSHDAGLDEEDIAHVQIRDFVLDGPEERFSAIVANPPYIRHHRLNADTKAKLQLIARSLIGRRLDGRTGYHVFFLIKALDRLKPGGRLAFIMPADTCEGVFSHTLWKWILGTYCLDAVVTFSHSASPFPNVDTNALIFMISASQPNMTFAWCRCDRAGTNELKQWVQAGFPSSGNSSVEAVRREVSEALHTGLSRPPQERHDGPILGDFVRTMRGIATGDNHFFFMTRGEAIRRGLPLEFLVRAVGRTRDVEGNELTEDQIEALDLRGRPSYLLSLDGREIADFPTAVQRYLRHGEEQRISDRPLIQQRRPWYKMETRKVPPFFFAYLGRRHARFVRNRAQVVPLTGFLCVYAKRDNVGVVDKLWKLLNHPDTLANLSRVAKSYGSGAIKVEPRALEKTPISESALRDSELTYDGLEPQVELAFGSSASGHGFARL